MLFSIQDLNKINNITFKEKLLLKKKKVSAMAYCASKNSNYPRAKIGVQYDRALMSSFTYAFKNLLYHNFK